MLNEITKKNENETQKRKGTQTPQELTPKQQTNEIGRKTVNNDNGLLISPGQNPNPREKKRQLSVEKMLEVRQRKLDAQQNEKDSNSSSPLLTQFGESQLQKRLMNFVPSNRKNAPSEPFLLDTGFHRPHGSEFSKSYSTFSTRSSPNTNRFDHAIETIFETNSFFEDSSVHSLMSSSENSSDSKDSIRQNDFLLFIDSNNSTTSESNKPISKSFYNSETKSVPNKKKEIRNSLKSVKNDNTQRVSFDNSIENKKQSNGHENQTANMDDSVVPLSEVFYQSKEFHPKKSQMKNFNNNNNRNRKSQPRKTLMHRQTMKSMRQTPPWLLHLDKSFVFNIHDEIQLFTTFIGSNNSEILVKTDLINRFRMLVRHYFPSFEVKTFGSFASNLSLVLSDIDIALFDPSLTIYSKIEALSSVSEFFLSMPTFPEHLSDPFPVTLESTERKRQHNSKLTQNVIRSSFPLSTIVANEKTIEVSQQQPSTETPLSDKTNERKKKQSKMQREKIKLCSFCLLDTYFSSENTDPKRSSENVVPISVPSFGIYPNWVQKIFTARIPVLKFLDQRTQCAFDVSVNTENGEHHITMLHTLHSLYPSLRPVVLLLKYYLRSIHSHEVYFGGLSSYPITIMVAFVIQNLRFLRTNGSMNTETYLDFKESEESDCEVIFTEFLRFYGFNSNLFDKYGISIGNGERNNGSFFEKAIYQEKENEDSSHNGIHFHATHNTSLVLFVEDPNDKGSNITKGCYRIQSIMIVFSQLYQMFGSHNAFEMINIPYPNFSVESEYPIFSKLRITNYSDFPQIDSFHCPSLRCIRSFSPTSSFLRTFLFTPSSVARQKEFFNNLAEHIREQSKECSLCQGKSTSHPSFQVSEGDVLYYFKSSPEQMQQKKADMTKSNESNSNGER